MRGLSDLYGFKFRKPRKNLVTTIVAQPPQKREKKASPHPTPSFSLLPEEILLDCIARSSKSDYRSLSLVSKSIHSLLSSPELYPARSWIGNTEPCLYLCQQLPTHDRWYTLDRTLTTTGWLKDDLSLTPIKIPSFYPGLSNSTSVAVGFEIYQMGGTINGRPSSAVRVLDCRTHTWRDAPDMTVARNNHKSCLIDGKIFVIEEETDAWGEVFDLKTQTWKPLMPCPITADNVEVLFERGKLYVRWEHIRYEYDSKQGRWEESLDKLEVRSVLGGPWCYIDNVKFGVVKRKFSWYDSDRRRWFAIKGLKDMYTTRAVAIVDILTIRLTNHGGKLVILWDEPRSLQFPLAGKRPGKRSPKFLRSTNRLFWCAVIRLEKRIGSSGLQIWGDFEWCNAVLTVPSSYKFLCTVTL